MRGISPCIFFATAMDNYLTLSKKQRRQLAHNFTPKAHNGKISPNQVRCIKQQMKFGGI